MPHDSTGRELQVGDEVVIVCKVETIYPDAEFCNLTLKSVEDRTDGSKETFSCQAKVVQKVWETPEQAEEYLAAKEEAEDETKSE